MSLENKIKKLEEHIVILELILLEVVETCIYEKHYRRGEVEDRFDKLMDRLKEFKASQTGWK